MKLIKISYILIIILSFSKVSFSTETIEGVKLNNEAAQLLTDAIESMQSSVKEPEVKEIGLLDKLLLMLFSKDDEKPKDPDQLKLEHLKGELKKMKSSKASPDQIQMVKGMIAEYEKKISGESEEIKKSEAEKKENGFNDLGMSKGLSEEQKKQAKINSELAYKAYKKTLEATIQNTSVSQVRMNLGLAFELSGDLDKSFIAYKMAEKFAADNLKLSFLAKYNMARVLGAQNKIDEALSTYQKALEINPTSKEVKVNIELLTQQKQGGGGGGGDDKDKKGEGDGEGDPSQQPQQKPQNNDYKPQNLSKDDVQKILKELKDQEQKIREKEYKKGEKEKPKNKDW